MNGGKKVVRYKIIIGSIFWLSLFFIGLWPTSLWAQMEKESTQAEKEVKRSAEEAVGEVLGNFIAIRTGQVKDGEQIPLPFYQDGKEALREESHYFVSPAEIPTSLTYITSSGAFYIKCSVDQNDGYARVSLWQQSGTGDGIKLVGADTYKQVQQQFVRPGVTSPTGEENIVAAQMKVLSERLLVNYMVISLRSRRK